MSSGKYSTDNPLSDLIPLEGAFVSTFLNDMPLLYIKIYVYLLYLCNHKEIKSDNIIQLAQTLNCTATELNDGMEYLHKKHLLNYTARPFSFEVLSATFASKTASVYSADSLTAYADYFAGIRALFPERSITNSEYDKARDWIEIYGLSVETALLLISHCISSKDKSISFSYIDKVAQSWSNDGIVTIDKAEEYLVHEQAKKHEVSKLLLHLGLKRTPTVDEIKLYQHWITDWGFDLKAIKAACQETTKSLNPSLAYINRILENLHNLDIHDEKHIKAYLSESDAGRRLASAILSELGERSRTVTSTHTEKISEYEKAGYSGEILIFIAKTMCEKGLHTFTKFCQKTDEMNAQNIRSKEEIKKYFETSQSTQSAKGKNGFKGRDTSYGDSLYVDTSKLEV